MPDTTGEQGPEQPEVHSIAVSPGVAPLVLFWEAAPQAEAYVLCRLHVAVHPDNWRVLQVGGLDLMMQRWVLPAAVRAVREEEPGGVPHRLVVARLPGGRLAHVPTLRVWPGAPPPGLPELGEFGPLARSWSDGVRVGTPPPPADERSRLRAPRHPGVRAEVQEPGGVSRQPPAFVERPLTVREGLQLRADASRAPSAPRSPLEAWEKQVAPRRRPGGSLPDLRVAPPPPAETGPEPAEPRPPRWAVVAAPTLLRDPAAARAAVRMLRGFLRVALVGLSDRAAIERWADQLGVPLDAVFALAGDAETLARALGCRADELVVFTLPGEPAPASARQVEVEPEGFAAAVERLCDEL
jgi:hypothetical protein